MSKRDVFFVDNDGRVYRIVEFRPYRAGDVILFVDPAGLPSADRVMADVEFDSFDSFILEAVAGELVLG